ncbi:MAG TPA: hypothetical protein VM075_02625 [Anaerolineae bacterium]|nr:hypothetical protein [Anaerolineae bacterium]
MDPITIIVTALAAGAAVAAKDVSAQVVKDGYAGLKALIVRKLGEKTDVADALEYVERKPESEARQEALKEELDAAEADQDHEVVQQAQAFLDLLNEHGLARYISYRAELRGPGAIAQGEGAVAAVEGGVAIHGDVEGGVIVTGDKNVVGEPEHRDD